MSGEYLYLKWGTLKGWRVESEAAKEALCTYASGGMTLSAMVHKDTPDQKGNLCALIDAIDGPITNDWTGDEMTKDEAKAYVRGYGS